MITGIYAFILVSLTTYICFYFSPFTRSMILLLGWCYAYFFNTQTDDSITNFSGINDDHNNLEVVGEWKNQ